MLIEKRDIIKYIPQREPFVMIDALLAASEKGFQSRFEIRSDHIFLVDGQLSDEGLVETIAQTCAAGFGYLASLEAATEPRQGYIGAVSRLEVMAPCMLHDLLETTVEILARFDNIYLIQGVVASGGKELLKCQMKIVRA